MGIGDHLKKARRLACDMLILVIVLPQVNKLAAGLSHFGVLCLKKIR
jgi:hypothetical protein